MVNEQLEMSEAQLVDLKRLITEEGKLTYEFFNLTLTFNSPILTGALEKIIELENISVIDADYVKKASVIEEYLDDNYGIEVMNGQVLGTEHAEMMSTGKTTLAFKDNGFFYNELYKQIRSKVCYSVSPTALYYVYLAFFKEAVVKQVPKIDVINSRHRDYFEKSFAELTGVMILELDKHYEGIAYRDLKTEEDRMIKEVIQLYKENNGTL